MLGHSEEALVRPLHQRDMIPKSADAKSARPSSRVVAFVRARLSSGGTGCDSTAHRGFMPWLIPLLLATGLASEAGETFGTRPWEDSVANVQLQSVSIATNTMRAAWEEISTKYLLRANLYWDVSGAIPFGLRAESTTAGELLAAFLAAYPTYTSSRDPETGVLWIHPVRVAYPDILSQRVKVDHAAMQVDVWAEVYMPLSRMLFPDGSAAVLRGGARPKDEAEGEQGARPFLRSYVDIPAGVYSARQILNLCCAASPTLAFAVAPKPTPTRTEQQTLTMLSLFYRNPLAAPRAGAVRFWQVEIGDTASGAPGIDKLISAMSDYLPHKRWAAAQFLEAAMMNYSVIDLVNKSPNAEQAIWAALAVEATRGVPDLLTWNDKRISRLRDDIRHISDPRLALVTCLELTREDQDASYLEPLIREHKYSQEEVDSVVSDVYRIIRASVPARKKLLSLRLDVPRFSAETLGQLGTTNLFSIAGTDGPGGR
jgi:hypothetical protein